MVNKTDKVNFVEDTLPPLSEGKAEKPKRKESGKGEVDIEDLNVTTTADVETEVGEVVTVEETPKTIEPPKKKKSKKAEVAGAEDTVNEPAAKEKKKSTPKKDRVLLALDDIADNSVDLLFFDPYNRLGDKEVTFKTPDERDKYIKRVQGWLTEAYKKLNPKGGNMVIGASTFSLSSFGSDIFPTEDIKRMLSWYRETERGALPLNRGYIPSIVPFLWGVKGKPWTFNLQDEEKFFTGEIKVDNGFVSDPVHFAQQAVRRFTNEGGTVLELYGKDTVIRKVVEDEGRKYVSGYVTTVDDK